MIQELTPQLLMVAMLLVGVAVPVVATLLSALLIWRYRAAVARAMSTTAGFVQQPTSAAETTTTVDVSRNTVDADRRAAMQRLLTKGPWCSARHYLVGAIAFALVFTAAAHVAYPHHLAMAGTLIAAWIYLWPYFLAVPMLVDMPWKLHLVWFAFYVGVYALLGIWAGSILDIPGYRFGAVDIPARSSVTPDGMLRLWFAVNLVPSVLALVSLNRRFRAVAPLVLALVTAAVSGLLGVYLAVFSEAGVDVVVAAATAMDLHVVWPLLATLVVTLSLFSVLGWYAMKAIATAYKRRRLSDQSLLIGVLWLLFASIYTMWLVVDDTRWLLVLPGAMLALILATSLARRATRQTAIAPACLVFLRVFSLGRRSERLFDTIAKHWRNIGSVQLITGPDLSRSTVQPQQFLDFLSGRLRRHFVSDHASLQRSLAERDRGVDPDGRFRVNGFFCHADSWQAVLPRLVDGGDIVLMDLRSFSPSNAGCTYELAFLVSHVPFRRCLLISDPTTDERLVDEVLANSLHSCLPTSPNAGRPLSELTRYRSTTGRIETTALLQQLCENACPSRAHTGSR